MPTPEYAGLADLIGETGLQIKKALGILTFADAVIGEDDSARDIPVAKPAEQAATQKRPRKDVTPKDPDESRNPPPRQEQSGHAKPR